MSTIVSSAPGKLFLLGEYAVLEGAPALIAAVGQRAVVTATIADTWQVSTRGHRSARTPLLADGSLPPGLDEETAEHLALFDEVRKHVASHLGGPGPSLDIDIDSTQFSHDGNKLGLGSSAAVAVAVVVALARARGQGLERESVFGLADAAHRAAQGGLGSGGDIAASVHGGQVLFRRGQPVMSTELPPGVTVLAVSTGSGSSTVELVNQIEDYRLSMPFAFDRDTEVLVRLAESITTALNSPGDLLTLAGNYHSALEELSRNSGAGIVTERHRVFHSLAAGIGAVFKPSGAGGGDLGLVFAKLEVAEQAQKIFTEAGAYVFTVPTRAEGARIDAA